MDVVYGLGRLDVSDLDRRSPRIPFEGRHSNNLASDSGRLGRVRYRVSLPIHRLRVLDSPECSGRIRRNRLADSFGRRWSTPPNRAAHGSGEDRSAGADAGWRTANLELLVR